MSLLDQLRDDLKSAMKARDQTRVDTIRTLISSIENAAAVPVEPGPYEVKIGLDHDVDRLTVTEDQMHGLVLAERDELLGAAREYRDHGLETEARDLEKQAQIAAGYVR